MSVWVSGRQSAGQHKTAAALLAGPSGLLPVAPLHVAESPGVLSHTLQAYTGAPQPDYTIVQQGGALGTAMSVLSG